MTELQKMIQAQAQAVKDVEATCIVMFGSDLTLEEFQEWVSGTISLYSDSDDDWDEIAKDFNIDINFIDNHDLDVYCALWNEEQLLERAKKHYGKCPYCLGSDAEAGLPDGNKMDAHCPDCNTNFTMGFELVSIKKG